MICKRCHNFIKHCDDFRCTQCDSKNHLKCGLEACKPASQKHGSGDLCYQWRCAACQNPVGTPPDNSRTQLLNAIHTIYDKFELINKIQLPKINSDLTELKSTTDKIFKQNEDILQKINKIDVAMKNNFQSLNSPKNFFRRKATKYAPTNNCDNKNFTPGLISDRTVYRPRRRSYMLNKVFNILNRKLRRINK
ncbi:uncharacterized protein LOC128683347 [Plodia interpunctella]|uniref:uncharacterized protein LOC128683347 n=1 Tax=Plodia interpunctella TaxID=58824 RepID=UPI0023677B82|nr:uncharacterized protein LOC128683347 [Plodia interpunctella]